MADLDDIRSRLSAISEELADVALDALRSVAAGDARADDGDAAVALERRATKARRAVDKAVATLADPAFE